jgi:hypothetical protein
MITVEYTDSLPVHFIVGHPALGRVIADASAPRWATARPYNGNYATQPVTPQTRRLVGLALGLTEAEIAAVVI